MFTQLAVQAAFGLNSAVARVQGGIIDALHIDVAGVTAATAADVTAAIKAVLAAIRVSGEYVNTTGQSSPFVSGPLFADHFRQIANLQRGYLSPDNGAIIQTGRRHMAQNEGFTVSLDWSGFDSAGLSGTPVFTAAKVEVRRVERTAVMQESLHPVYAARQDDGRHIGALVPNLVQAFYSGGSLANLTLQQAGRDNEIPMSLLAAVSGFSYRHEDEGEEPLTVIYDADLASSGSPPTFLTEVTGSLFGTIIQIGARPDRVAVQRAVRHNSNRVGQVMGTYVDPAATTKPLLFSPVASPSFSTNSSDPVKGGK